MKLSLQRQDSPPTHRRSHQKLMCRSSLYPSLLCLFLALSFLFLNSTPANSVAHAHNWPQATNHKQRAEYSVCPARKSNISNPSARKVVLVSSNRQNITHPYPIALLIGTIAALAAAPTKHFITLFAADTFAGFPGLMSTHNTISV